MGAFDRDLREMYEHNRCIDNTKEPELTDEMKFDLLFKWARRLDKELKDLQTEGRPKYGTKHESAELPMYVVMPPLLDFNFRQLRKDKGLTLREVQESTGLSNAYLSQLETGKIKSPSYKTIRCLINIYCNGA